MKLHRSIQLELNKYCGDHERTQNVYRNSSIKENNPKLRDNTRLQFLTLSHYVHGVDGNFCFAAFNKKNDYFFSFFDSFMF